MNLSCYDMSGGTPEHRTFSQPPTTLILIFLLNLAPQSVSGSACKCGVVNFSAVIQEETGLKLELCPLSEIVLW